MHCDLKRTERLPPRSPLSSWPAPTPSLQPEWRPQLRASTAPCGATGFPVPRGRRKGDHIHPHLSGEKRLHLSGAMEETRGSLRSSEILSLFSEPLPPKSKTQRPKSQQHQKLVYIINPAGGTPWGQGHRNSHNSGNAYRVWELPDWSLHLCS